MSENYKIQVSVKIPHDQDNYRDSMLNIRAETAEELDALLGYVEQKGAQLGSLVAAVRAGANVGTGIPGSAPANPVQHYQQAAAAPQDGGASNPATAPGAPWQGQQQAPQPSWSQQGTQQAAPAAGQAPAPQCAHGLMQYRESKPGAAKTWKAWMCSAPKGPGQCEPNWIR